MTIERRIVRNVLSGLEQDAIIEDGVVYPGTSPVTSSGRVDRRVNSIGRMASHGATRIGAQLERTFVFVDDEPAEATEIRARRAHAIAELMDAEEDLRVLFGIRNLSKRN